MKDDRKLRHRRDRKATKKCMDMKLQVQDDMGYIVCVYIYIFAFIIFFEDHL